MTTLPPNISSKFNAETATDRPDRLSRAEFQLAMEAIKRDYFLNARLDPHPDPLRQPSLIYVTGLAGSGKSTFVKAHQQHDAVHINFDDLRHYHPRYLEHVKNSPLHAAARTDLAVVALFDEAVREARRQKLNILIDDAPVDALATLTLLEDFKSAGYHLSVVILATPFALCQRRVDERFEEALALFKNGGDVIPRFVNMDEQEKAPKILIETINLLVKKAGADQITILDEAGRKLYCGKVETSLKLGEMVEKNLLKQQAQPPFLKKTIKK